jgi:hypothetical protein
MPEIRRIQPMNTVAINVETIRKMTAPMSSTSSTTPSKNNRLVAVRRGS